MDNDVSQKINFIDQYIGDLARKLADSDKILEERLKTEIREIVLQNDLRSSSEEVSSLLKILSGENSEANTETIVKAKEANLELNRWVGENIDSVRTFRGEDLTTNLVAETIKNNPNITKEQIKTVQFLAENVNKLYNSDGGVENQKDAVLEENKLNSIGQVKNAWNDTQGINGLMKQSPRQYKEIINSHEKITTELDKDNIKIDYSNSDKLSSYDRTMNLIKNPEMRRFIESARSKFKTLDRITNGKFSQAANNFVSRIGGDRIRNVANNFFNKSIVKISNGFASKIGNQVARDFVQKSMGSILKNGVGQGMKSIMQGAMKKGAQMAGKAAMNVAAKMGLKAAALGLKAALGAATAGLGYIAMAGWEALKLGGKLIGKIIGALGLELTNNKMADIIIFITIGLLVLLGGLGTMTANNVSSLVPEVETEDNGISKPPTHGEITMTEDGRIKSCGVGMVADFLRKTHKTWVTPGVLMSGGYDKQLEETIGDQFGKRCGVVYAAQYLASDFEFWIPYYWAGKYSSKGLNPKWGGETKPDIKGRHLVGLDCSGFVMWASINGYGGRGGSSGAISFGNCEAIKAAIQPGDTLTMPSGEPYHVALVLEYDNQKIKFAHSGGGSGVTTGLIDICSGKLVGGNMTFGYLHKKTY